MEKTRLLVIFLWICFMCVGQVLADWPMAGANPQRTSWVSEEVRTNNTLLWWKTITPFIPHKVQVIGVGNLVYISTADGVYALDYDDGDQAWHYATTMPVGHSPTIDNGVLYVGCFDRKLHAVNALTGSPVWTFTGGRGFDTNPLVVNGKVYAGCRDGKFYCVDAATGNETWQYDTGRPISYSAAYDNGVVFFASQDSCAYALDAADGSLVWKSATLPGHGFYVFWPVVYGDRIVFAGSHMYGIVHSPWGDGMMPGVQDDEAWPPGTPEDGPLGPHIGNNWYDATYCHNYLTNKPYRRTMFMLNKYTGQEAEVISALYQGNEGQDNRHPPVVGGDGLLYTYSAFLWTSHISWARVVGWDINNPHLLYYADVQAGEAVDKPGAISACGNVIYINCARGHKTRYFDIVSGSGTNFGASPAGWDDGWQRFKYGIWNDIYDLHDTHGYMNAPIPFHGRIYLNKVNSIYCFGS